jgi:hypothetical protein
VPAGVLLGILLYGIYSEGQSLGILAGVKEDAYWRRESVLYTTIICVASCSRRWRGHDVNVQLRTGVTCDGRESTTEAVRPSCCR